LLTKRIIPCLDVKGGRVVKGIQFRDHRDAGDPVEMASFYDREGADELVFYDITASSDGREIMRDVVSRVAEQVFIPLTVGGGIRSVNDMRLMLNAGADKISINTAAVENPELIREGSDYFGSQCIVLGLDAIRSKDFSIDHPSWTVRVRTGKAGGIDVGLDAIEWAIKAVDLGVGEIVANSIDSDGTTEGYDIELLKALYQVVNVPVVASGGAGTKKHILNALVNGEADAALAATIFHYGTYSIEEVKEYLLDNGIPIRMST